MTMNRIGKPVEMGRDGEGTSHPGSRTEMVPMLLLHHGTATATGIDLQTVPVVGERKNVMIPEATALKDMRDTRDMREVREATEAIVVGIETGMIARNVTLNGWTSLLKKSPR